MTTVLEAASLYIHIETMVSTLRLVLVMSNSRWKSRISATL